MGADRILIEQITNSVEGKQAKTAVADQVAGGLDFLCLPSEGD
jgi:hypothetical protein